MKKWTIEQAVLGNVLITEGRETICKDVRSIKDAELIISAPRLKAKNERLEKERNGLREAVDKTVDRLYEITAKHGGDIEGVTRGRICHCATTLNKKAIALAEGGKEKS